MTEGKITGKRQINSGKTTRITTFAFPKIWFFILPTIFKFIFNTHIATVTAITTNPITATTTINNTIMGTTIINTITSLPPSPGIKCMDFPEDCPGFYKR